MQRVLDNDRDDLAAWAVEAAKAAPRLEDKFGLSVGDSAMATNLPAILAQVHKCKYRLGICKCNTNLKTRPDNFLDPRPKHDLISHTLQLSQLKDMFRVFDVDGNGVLNKEEYVNYLTTMGCTSMDPECIF